MKAYRVAGTTDEMTNCELCGRNELNGTVVLEPLDADGNGEGVYCYFGSSCAAKAAGWTQREVTLRVKAAEEAKQRAERARRIADRDAETKAYKAWVADTYGAGLELKAAVQKYGAAGLWQQFRAGQANAVEAQPADALVVVTVDAPASCPVLLEPGNIHFMTAHCVDCNAYRMARMNLEAVESWYHYGNFNQDEYEAYMHVWATSTVRHSAGDWTEVPTIPAVVALVSAIRRHAGLGSPVDLAA
ncbi:hypothetical protein ABT264_19265 [Streptomyces virginiae]|uniref:hypothetical protein n=1 Tax=Streptomyces virginiae TaxID=1961 RepID=UPI0033213FC3